MQAALDEAKAVIGDSTTWLEQEKATSATTLRHLALLVRKWLAGVRREKAVFHTLNMFLRTPERGTVSVQAWVLKTSVAAVQACVQDAHVAAAQGGRLQPFYLEVLTGGAGLPKPPTYFKTNKITRVFQKIVDTYGVPRYGEVNPALFSIVTFPFLFGVMYGDVGHGLILTAFAAYMLLKEADLAKSDLGEIFTMAFKGRYMLFMMGCFSVYCGIVYNDMFSIGMTGFGTKWSFGNSTHFEHEGTFTGGWWRGGGGLCVRSSTAPPPPPVLLQAPTRTTSCPWASTPRGTTLTTCVRAPPCAAAPLSSSLAPPACLPAQELLFFNSLKMKMSVILGITQMTFGLVLKVFNALHFKSAADLWLEAIPQVRGARGGEGLHLRASPPPRLVWNAMRAALPPPPRPLACRSSSWSASSAT